MTFAAMMLVALLTDALVGWPAALFARIGHPVTWIGRLIAALDHRLNRPDMGPTTRRLAGILTVVVLVAVVAIPACVMQGLLPDGAIGIVLGGLLAWPLIAARSMHDHVTDVVRPLVDGDIAAARDAVSRIVGRDPTQLDEVGIGRATLESLAENTSDGIVAPVFWGVLLGLPGIAAYKAVNTMDSMIGHRTERHEAFGWAAARLDDLVNLVPARLTGVLFALASSRPWASSQVMLRDARRHRSPNAGWPEAAMAGALDIRLSGPRIYGDRTADEPWLNEGAPDPDPATVRRALALYRRSMILLAAALAGLALI